GGGRGHVASVAVLGRRKGIDELQRVARANGPGDHPAGPAAFVDFRFLLFQLLLVAGLELRLHEDDFLRGSGRCIRQDAERGQNGEGILHKPECCLPPNLLYVCARAQKRNFLRGAPPPGPAPSSWTTSTKAA